MICLATLFRLSGVPGWTQGPELVEKVPFTLDPAEPFLVETGHRASHILSEYLSRAAIHNPDLEAAFNRWKAELDKISQ